MKLRAGRDVEHGDRAVDAREREPPRVGRRADARRRGRAAQRPTALGVGRQRPRGNRAGAIDGHAASSRRSRAGAVRRRARARGARARRRGASRRRGSSSPALAARGSALPDRAPSLARRPHLRSWRRATRRRCAARYTKDSRRRRARRSRHSRRRPKTPAAARIRFRVPMRREERTALGVPQHAAGARVAASTRAPVAIERDFTRRRRQREIVLEPPRREIPQRDACRRRPAKRATRPRDRRRPARSPPRCAPDRESRRARADRRARRCRRTKAPSRRTRRCCLPRDRRR